MSTEPISSPPATHKHSHHEIHEVTFITYPKLLFIWPLLLAGFVFYPIAGYLNEHALSTMGWAYLFIAVLVIMALGVDVNRNQAAFWVVLIFGVWILGLWLRDVKGITVFGNIYNFFASINAKYDRGFGLALSLILLVPYVIMIAWARINDRWRITHNEFEHYSFGKMDDALGRGSKTIRADFPDVFEMILGMAGTLIVYNANGNQELRRIPHVMFLPFVRSRLNKILERTAITTDTTNDDEDDQDV